MRKIFMTHTCQCEGRVKCAKNVKKKNIKKSVRASVTYFIFLMYN